MDKFYNERNEFDEGLYNEYVKTRRRRAGALLAAITAGFGIAGGVIALTKEEITYNNIRLINGQYDTVFNPDTLDVAILVNIRPADERTTSDYCYDVINNRVVLRENYKEGYYSLDLRKMVKDGSIDTVKSGINKYRVLEVPSKIQEAAQVRFALDYMESKGNPGVVEEYNPKFDVVMVNDLQEGDKSIELSPYQDLGLYNRENHTFAYIHLDKEQCLDIITGEPIDVNAFVGSSPVNVFYLVETGAIESRKIEGGGEDGKDLYVISACNLVEHVYYNFSDGKPIKIGSME